MFTHECKSVPDLLAKCRSLSASGLSGRWFFRGQRNSRWSLKPSLLRTDVATSGVPDPKAFEAGILNYMRRVMTERTSLPDRIVGIDENLLAIAQHYGVRTRLLDWSRDPSVALYFAASDALRVPLVEKSSLSVFALGDIYLNLGEAGKRAEIVRPLRAANPNLAAQNGLHTKARWEQPDLWDSSHEQQTSDPLANLSDSKMAARLVRLDLPCEKAPEAVQHLLDRGVDAFSLFPTEHGLARLAEDLTRLGGSRAEHFFDPKSYVLRPSGE